jgi:hypothetical protein
MRRKAVGLALAASLSLMPLATEVYGKNDTSGSAYGQPSSKKKKKCTPGYKPCLKPASDYDCAGGSGDGPKYVSGPVTVTGSDPYGLDSDNDGIGCE